MSKVRVKLTCLLAQSVWSIKKRIGMMESAETEHEEGNWTEDKSEKK